MSINRYRTPCLMRGEHRPPPEILSELRAIKKEILQVIEELEAILR